MKKVAVAGAAGYVGSQIAKAIVACGRYQLIPVTRADVAEKLFFDADIIVHAANPARRFRAEKEPERDFEETVEKTAGFISAARNKRLVLVSSLSCRTQLSTSYGRHRRACELMALAAGDSLVVRLGPMYGGDRTTDSLHDILAGRPVFVSADTRYAYVDVAWAGQKIVDLLESPGGIREIGASNSIRLGDLCERFSSSSAFSGADDTQIPEGFTEGPDAQGVILFAEKEAVRIQEWA